MVPTISQGVIKFLKFYTILSTMEIKCLKRTAKVVPSSQEIKAHLPVSTSEEGVLEVIKNFSWCH